MGEGGAILIKDKDKAEEAEILREKGTNRSKFFRGQIDKYTWVNYGSSYLPSDMNAAYLYAQLLQADMINNYRLNIWNTYYDGFGELEKSGRLSFHIYRKAVPIMLICSILKQRICKREQL